MCSIMQFTGECHLNKLDGRRKIEEALQDLFQGLREVTLEKDTELSQNSRSSPEQEIVGDDGIKFYTSEIEYQRVENLRTAGNELFAMGDWNGATEMYSKGIVIMEKIAEGADHYEWRCQLMLLTYSNRAEAHYRLNYIEDALIDANKALEIDRRHARTLARKGKILDALEQYELSRQCFNAAMVESPRDLSIQRAIARSKVSYQQAHQGVFDLTRFYLDGKKAKPPQCCNFVGPVEIRKSHSAGRGLFATRNVKAGDLLVVSNALASAPDKETLVAQVSSLCSSSRKRLRQIYALSSELQILSGEDNAIPSMDLFRPGSQWKIERAAGLQPDLVRIHGIVKVNAITVWDSSLCNENSSSGQETEDFEMKYSALWLLPSFINHSCTPNCVTYNPGRDVLFIRACRDISAGDELHIAYFDILKDSAARQQSTSAWPFICRCPRCTWECSFPRTLNEVRRKLLPVVQKAKSDCHECLSAERLRVPRELACLILTLEKVIQRVNLETMYQSWVRASIMDVYLASSRVLVAVLVYIEPVIRIQVLKTLVDAITAVGGGDGICLEIGVLLYEQVQALHGKQSDESFIAEVKLMEVFKLFHGKLTRNVFSALVSSHSHFKKCTEDWSMDSKELWNFMEGLFQCLQELETSLLISLADFDRFAGNPLSEMD